MIQIHGAIYMRNEALSVVTTNNIWQGREGHEMALCVYEHVDFALRCDNVPIVLIHVLIGVLFGCAAPEY